ncbi:hypothetical protein Pan258_02100 [Symmachiella dynata]|uniref:hypothetical protein n=1 Tax=Symmachiella dynata TaxID=2527995 RepID=UPI0011890EF6|nr:hypothetical protein [Symmachiella dynata]QDT46193.1 hypothetical protein Pan258_02100 [Symmachiella dynata]
MDYTVKISSPYIGMLYGALQLDTRVSEKKSRDLLLRKMLATSAEKSVDGIVLTIPEENAQQFMRAHGHRNAFTNQELVDVINNDIFRASERNKLRPKRRWL